MVWRVFRGELRGLKSRLPHLQSVPRGFSQSGWTSFSLAPQLLWVCAEHVLVHGEARLWDLVGSGSATWVTSAGHKDTNASG